MFSDLMSSLEPILIYEKIFQIIEGNISFRIFSGQPSTKYKQIKNYQLNLPIQNQLINFKTSSMRSMED